MDGSSRKVQNASAHSINLRTTKAHSQFNGALDESSRNVQNVSAHSVTLRTNKARSSQFSGALEAGSRNVQKANTLPHIPAHTKHTLSSAGRWTKVHGKFKMRAHIGSLISVHVRVGQRCRARDVESPAILPNMSKRGVPAGQWMQVQGKFKDASTHN